MSDQIIMGELRAAIITTDIHNIRDLLSNPTYESYLNKNPAATKFLVNMAKGVVRVCWQIKDHEKADVAAEIADLIAIAASSDKRHADPVGPSAYRHIELSADGFVVATRRDISGNVLGSPAVRANIPPVCEYLPPPGFTDRGFERDYGEPAFS